MRGDAANPTVITPAAALPVTVAAALRTIPRELGEPAAAAGAVALLTSTDPAANTEVSYTLLKPALLFAAQLQVVQGLTQTPLPRLVITDAADVEIYSAPGSSALMTASTTANFRWGVGLASTALLGATPNIYSYAQLPKLPVLPTGYKIKTSTIGIGANTNLSAMTMFVVEYTV